jgi:hypothetical protein
MTRGSSRAVLLPLTRLALLALLGMGTTPSIACSDSCDVTSGLGEPYRVAIQSPETFDVWVDRHPGYFTEARVSCLVEKEQQAYQREIDLLDQCDEHFAGDPEGLDFCRSSIENPEDFTTFWRAVLFAGTEQGSFLSTGVGRQLALYRQDDPAFYDRMVSDLFTKMGPMLDQGLECRTCNRPWYRIF